MLIRDLNNVFYFTTGAFLIANSIEGLRIISNNARESNVVLFTDNLDKQECMGYIYKCYRRDDRCCDLNDLLKKDNEK